MKVAIIGAGVSGLYAAYLLASEGENVTVFESSVQIGGAAQTLQLNLGGTTRWADMGVNDFNRSTYKLLGQLLDKFGVTYKPLSDTTAFYKQDGSVSFTLDEQWNTPMPDGMKAEYTRFMKEAPEVLTDPKYANYSVGQYLEEKGYSTQFADWNIFPRVNGMYFAHDTTPATMPIRGVMHYYTLQEGFGAAKPAQRMYFENGTSSWIDALAQHAQAAGAQIRLNTNVQIVAGSDNVQVLAEGGSETFDACIIACHAKNALNLFRGGITQDIVTLLSAFDYTDSVAIAHTFAPVLPLDKNAWRTYNILIHEHFAQLRPYTISYVVNQHQNDMGNPPYNQFGTPYYFVTLNPSLPIPDSSVLQTVGPNPAPAIAYFPHNVYNLGAMAAQETVSRLQGQNNVFFCGGWTHGAGLQEECLLSGLSAAWHVWGRSHRTHQYQSDESQENYAPAYVREAIEGDA